MGKTRKTVFTSLKVDIEPRHMLMTKIQAVIKRMVTQIRKVKTAIKRVVTQTTKKRKRKTIKMHWLNKPRWRQRLNIILSMDNLNQKNQRKKDHLNMVSTDIIFLKCTVRNPQVNMIKKKHFLHQE